jgi:hypothetical protein
MLNTPFESKSQVAVELMSQFKTLSEQSALTNPSIPTAELLHENENNAILQQNN